MRQLLIAIVGLLLTIGWTFPAEAAICRQVRNREMCIVSIKRSAKHYWEYFGTVSVDGTTRPTENFDCRDYKRSRDYAPRGFTSSATPIAEAGSAPSIDSAESVPKSNKNLTRDVTRFVCEFFSKRATTF